MKLQIVLILLFFPALLSAQTKRVTGKVYRNDDFFVTYDSSVQRNIILNKYKIYLLKTDKVGANGKLKLRSKQEEFDIVLSKKEQKTYRFLEISTDGYSKIIKIDTLSELFQLHYLSMKNIFVGKPIIYLYPTETQEVEIKHTFKGKVLNTYPEYKNSWKVLASPNGLLKDLSDQRLHHYLFWDGEYTFPKEHYNYTSGFLVKRDNIISFLQEKLATIGLNDIEANDFISYWLPLMKKNEVNFVYFQINNNLGNSSFLDVKPQPQSEVRVFMEFYNATNQKHILPEQQLPKLARKGFTLVEWGGGEIPILLNENN